MQQNLIMPKQKILPIIALLDTSGSMSGDGKIQQLNIAVKDMLNSFKNEQSIQAEIQIAIITFGGTAQIHTPLNPASTLSYTDLSAHGGTPMGAALELASTIIEDKSKIPKNSYRPTVILVSDGAANDTGWEAKLTNFTTTGRSSKCDRWSLAIGADADLGTMGKFLDTSKKNVLFVDNAKDIHKFFKFISTCTIKRSQSNTPNKIPTELFETDLSNINFGDL